MVVATRVVCCAIGATGGEQAGEDPGDEWFERGETGADDYAVDFDDGPDGDAEVVVGGVCGCRGLGEGFEADDGDYADAGWTVLVDSTQLNS